MPPYFEVAFMPHLGMDDVRELTFGKARVWNLDLAADLIASHVIRQRVQLLLGMYRQPARQPNAAARVRGIGVLAVGAVDQLPIAPAAFAAMQALQRALFLACLARNVQLHGPNAGASILTADNFDIVRQRFTLDNEYISEQTGLIVSMNLMGYKISETIFPTPTYIPRPIRFFYDDRLLKELDRLRRHDPKLLRRLLEATEVFRLSYYNSQLLGISARILLQASAFEMLLDLPDRGQRLAFKNTIERLLAKPDERRYRYKYEHFDTFKAEARTVKGIWADRFYTLRNHLIHGNRIGSAEYKFRGAQHHLVISPQFFVSAVKALIDESRVARGAVPLSDTRLYWRNGPTNLRLDEEDDVAGFRVDTDWARIVAEFRT